MAVDFLERTGYYEDTVPSHRYDLRRLFGQGGESDPADSRCGQRRGESSGQHHGGGGQGRERHPRHSEGGVGRGLRSHSGNAGEEGGTPAGADGKSPERNENKTHRLGGVSRCSHVLHHGPHDRPAGTYVVSPQPPDGGTAAILPDVAGGVPEPGLLYPWPESPVAQSAEYGLSDCSWLSGGAHLWRGSPVPHGRRHGQRRHGDGPSVWREPVF